LKPWSVVIDRMLSGVSNAELPNIDTTEDWSIIRFRANIVWIVTRNLFKLINKHLGIII